MTCLEAHAVYDNPQASAKAKERSKMLDASLKSYSPDNSDTLLILGRPASGKSTFVKSIRFLLDPNGMELERKPYRLAILLSIVRTAKSVLSIASATDNSNEGAMRLIRLQPLLDLESSLLESISVLNIPALQSITSEQPIHPLLPIIPSKWKQSSDNLSKPLVFTKETDWPWTGNSDGKWVDDDPYLVLQQSYEDLKALFQSYSTIPISPTAQYFVTSLPRLCAPHYTPTNHDILTCRISTIGIDTYRLKFGTRALTLLDVAGSCTSSKFIWASYLSKLTTLVYLVDLDVYDSLEMQEALALFAKLCNAKLLEATPIVILFNKEDLFEKKLGEITAPSVLKSLRRKFKKLNGVENRPCWTHVTCALSRHTVQQTIRFVSDNTLKRTLESIDLL